MGEAMGIHGVGGTVGVMFTPIVAFAIGVAVDWRISFIVFGIFSIFVGVILSRNRTQTIRNQTKPRILEVFKIKGLLTILIFNIFIGLYMKGIELFLPTYLVLRPFSSLNEGTAEFWAATAATLVLASGVLGQWLGGRSADRVGSKKVLVTVSAGITAALLFLLFTPPAFAFVGVAAFIILYGLSFYGHQPALNSLTGILTPPEQRGAVYGIFFFTSFGLGSLSQAITGYMMTTYPANPEYSFYFLTVVAAIALVLSTLIPSKRQKPTEQPHVK
jgi:MFS family permease